MDERERRWERMKRLMEFIFESDARISATLDRIGKRLDSASTPVDTVSSVGWVPLAPAEPQHEQLSRISSSVDRLRLQMRLKRLKEIAEEIREVAGTLSASTFDHEREGRLPEDPIPPGAV